MKKLLLIGIILLTGCVSNADFEKECTKITDSNYLKEKVVMDIFYDNNDITKNVIYTRNFKIKDDGIDVLNNIKEASLSFNERYEGKGVDIIISKDDESQYEVIYSFDARDVDNSVLKDFSVKKNSIKLFNDLKKKGLDCEVKDGNN